MCALTNAIRKETAALASAKGRRSQGAFMAEGTRCVLECLPLFKARRLFATPAWSADHPSVAATIVEQKEIDRMSQQQTPQGVLAVFEMPEPQPFRPDGRLTLALDAVQDPGNLGTIIRLADWFGITQIIAGHGTADHFAPKVVQATMGALGRVRVHRVDSLPEALKSSDVLMCKPTPIIGTFLDGKDLYKSEIPLNGHSIVIMGNEGNGISPQVGALCNYRVKIPSFPPGRQTVESLNVAMAAGIIISELSRRIYG